MSCGNKDSKKIMKQRMHYVTEQITLRKIKIFNRNQYLFNKKAVHMFNLEKLKRLLNKTAFSFVDGSEVTLEANIFSD